MKTVLITRVKKQSTEIAKALKNDGYNVLIEPLFSVEKLPVVKILYPVSAVIITSANACFALFESGLPKTTKIFSVGKKTTKKLSLKGFKNIVFSPENSAESLSRLIDHDMKDILYFHGSVVSFNFAQKFKNVKNVLVYKTHEIESFSESLLRFIEKNSCDKVLIFSKNSAEIFAKLVKRYNLLEYFSDSQILCLSEKILECIKNLGFVKVKNFSSISTLKKFYE